MALSIRVGVRFLLAGLATLFLSACQAPPRTLQVGEIAPGRTLVRDGLAPAGNLVVTIDDTPVRCRAPQTWSRAGDDWREAAQGPALRGAACPTVTTQLGDDGRTLVIYNYSAGRAEMLDLADGRITPIGTASIGGRVGVRFPPPGPNLSISSDGQKLLLGSLNHGCRVLAGGGRECGQAELFERRAGSWERTAIILPVPELVGRVGFGQSVALEPAAQLAMVGGTGGAGLSGALGVYALHGPEPRLVQILEPSKPMWGFATDLSLSGDGRWLAVGGGHSVHVYERSGDGFVLHKVLIPPDLAAGYFGETVALSRDGRRLLIGAPRTDCAEGPRCGLVYLFERDRFWRLARTIRPATSLPEANFGHHLALSADGRHAAVQGAGLHMFTLGG